MKKAISIFLLFISTCQLYAQTENLFPGRARTEFQAKQVIPPGPIAAELGKYGNVPVSLFTGTPNIDIPLHELKGNALALPISLSYYASGFKPQDMATWVGSGWSLNAGGVITRAVIGNPDTRSNYFSNTPVFDPLAYHPNSIETINYMSMINSGHIETRPDEYYYNFAGKSGKFFIGQDGKVMKDKKDMLIIESEINGDPGFFTITDENGVVYKFKEIESSRIIPSDAGGGSMVTYDYPSSWFLTQIQSPDGIEQINFEYYAPKLPQQMFSNIMNNQSYVYEYRTDNLLCSRPFNESYGAEVPTVTVRRTFLTKITMRRGGKIIAYVDLNSTISREDSDFSQDRLLNQIKVYSVLDGISKPIKQYDFTYGYFVNNNNLYTKKRLRLDRLQEVSSINGTMIKPPYEFNYQDGTLPDRTTLSLDHWGFFNNAGNSSLVPSASAPQYYGQGMITFGGNANREPSLDGAECTVLKKIKYPTGGYTIFEYEGNVANSQDRVVSIGGLRIKKIVDYSFAGQVASTKVYDYTIDGFVSSGSAVIPQYLRITSRSSFLGPQIILPSVSDGLPANPCDKDSEKRYSVYTLSANSIYGLGSVKGSHIGYSQVSESNVDPSGKPLGKTTYNYEVGNFSEYGNDIRSGELLKKSVYRNDGKLLTEQRNIYRYQIIDLLPAYALKVGDFQSNKIYLCKMSDGAYKYLGDWEPRTGVVSTSVVYTRYFLYGYNAVTAYNRLDSTIVKNYDAVKDSYTRQVTTYGYDNPAHTYPSRITQNSNGISELVTLKKYAADFNPSTNNDINSSTIQELNRLNLRGSEIESVQYRQNSNGTNKRYIGGILITYKHTGIPRPGQLYQLESFQPLASVQSSAITNGVFTYDPSYKLAGTFDYLDGNLVEQSKDGAPQSSYIWDYDSMYPVASVTNSAVSSIAYTSFETAATGSWVVENVAIDPLLAFSGTRSAVLSPESKISRAFKTIPSQLLISYWSRNGALNLICNGNAVVLPARQGDQVNGWTYYEHLLPAGTGFLSLKTLSGSATIDELRLYPKDAQMQTSAYYPQIGLNTSVSESNQAKYFEYDNFNRLLNTRNSKKELLQNFGYNYGPGIVPVERTPTLFYNAPFEKGFTRQGCVAGEPELIIYKVPGDKYAAASQPGADALAVQEANENGQANANAKGRCLFYNTSIQKKVFRNNCPPEMGPGGHVIYIVPARKHAAESQAEAQAMAVADLANNAQAYANNAAGCGCEGEGKKYLNGICETGVIIYISSTGVGNGQFKCVYKYHFSDDTYSDTYTKISSSSCINN